MELEKRTTLLQHLNRYITLEPPPLTAAIEMASVSNPWFTPEFIRLAIKSICTQMLDPEKLKAWIHHYCVDDNILPKKVGIVMAGNIPLVGFHDLLSVFAGGHHALIKASSKDQILIKHVTDFLKEKDPASEPYFRMVDKLNDCDAIIATGNNQSADLFETYFAHLPHIIRRNKTSVAVITGNETAKELEQLADDVHCYFGLGCRNVTKLYVPQGYDFIPMIEAFKKYSHLGEHHKYRNNFDYQLSLLILNNKFYMVGGPTILAEENSIFSAIGVLHYSFYQNESELIHKLETDEQIQCLVSRNHIPFGTTQEPELFQYADGVDVMQFLLQL